MLNSLDKKDNSKNPIDVDLSMLMLPSVWNISLVLYNRGPMRPEQLVDRFQETSKVQQILEEAREKGLYVTFEDGTIDTCPEVSLFFRNLISLYVDEHQRNYRS